MSARAQAMRRGVCPSLSAPMATGDGLLVRLQAADGAFSPFALAGLAEAAARHGNGILEITARGNLQIRGLTEASAALLAAEVNGIGITPRTGVPVETGPLAGLDPHEKADPRPLAAAIRLRAQARGLAARLGPKVSVVVDGGGRFGLGALLADIRAQAVSLPDGTRWHLGLGGTGAEARPLGLFPEEEAARVVLDLLEEIARGGRSARGRDLAGRLVLARPNAWGRGSAAHSQVKLEGDPMPALGAFALRDGRMALSVALPFGRIDAAELAAYGTNAAASGATELRPALGRNLLALGLDAAGAVQLKRRAERLGLVTDPADPRLAVVACAGAPGCASAHLDTKRLAAALAGDWGEPQGVHVSGCAKRCAEPAGHLPSIVGLPGGWAEVDAGDETLRVEAEKAPAAMRRLLEGERRDRDAAPPARHRHEVAAGKP